MQRSEDLIEIDFLTNLLKKHGYKNINFKSNEEYEEFLICELQKLNGFTFDSKTRNQILNPFTKYPSKSSFDFAKYIWDKDKIPIESNENNHHYKYELFRPKFVDWENIEKNSITIAQQPWMWSDGKKYIPDVLILINGMPFIVIELKKRNVKVEKALEQLAKYREQVFSKGIFRFIQILIASNEEKVKLWANNRGQHSNFAFNWEHEGRKKLEDFANLFLDKKKLFRFLQNSIVFKNQDQQIVALRPYQTRAVEKVLNFVDTKIDENNIDVRNNKNNAYIWHTTGSGKTITSFKISETLSKNKDIDKVIFLLDRKDLSVQTTTEFKQMYKSDLDLFSAESTKHLEDLLKKEKFIITTIQKLNKFLEKWSKNIAFLKEKKIIFVIDECHRSQMGNMNQRIRNHLPQSIMIGFTGTPIFEQSSKNENHTESIFGNRLDTYNILDAIKDKNVLGFSLKDYFSNNQIGITENKISPEQITKEIEKKHFDFTRNRTFNAMFAFDDITELVTYYKEIKNINNLFVTAVFTNQTHKEENDLDEHNNVVDKNKNFDADRQDILDSYNAKMGTSFKLDNWEDYVKDVQKKFKDTNSKIDILLVVSMMLTGYDSKKINTLYVNKKMNSHTMIQAFSRTNRISGNDKRHGNIVNFSLTRESMDKAFSVYSDANIKQIEENIYGKKYEDILESTNLVWHNIQNNRLSENEIVITEDNFQEHEEIISKFNHQVALLTESINDLKTFPEFDINDIDSFDEESFFQKQKMVRDFKNIWQKNKIEKSDFQTEISESDFEIESYDEFNIDYEYLYKLLNIEAIHSQLVDKKWMIDDIIYKLEQLKNDSIKILDDKVKYEGMSEENKNKNSNMIIHWYDEFTHQLMSSENKDIYSKKDFKELKITVLQKMLEKTIEKEIRKIQDNYPEVNKTLLLEDFETRKHNKFKHFGGHNYPKFLNEYFESVFNNAKKEKLQKDYEELINYYIELENLVLSLSN